MKCIGHILHRSFNLIDEHYTQCSAGRSSCYTLGKLWRELPQWSLQWGWHWRFPKSRPLRRCCPRRLPMLLNWLTSPDSGFLQWRLSRNFYQNPDIKIDFQLHKHDQDNHRTNQCICPIEWKEGHLWDRHPRRRNVYSWSMFGQYFQQEPEIQQHLLKTLRMSKAIAVHLSFAGGTACLIRLDSDTVHPKTICWLFSFL